METVLPLGGAILNYRMEVHYSIIINLYVIFIKTYVRSLEESNFEREKKTATLSLNYIFILLLLFLILHNLVN